MLKKFSEPYRHAPARVSVERIDAALAARAQAELQSSGQRGLRSVDMVTFRTLDGRIVDQFPVSGHVASTAEFVASYNRKLASLPPLAPPPPPYGYPQQGYPQQSPPGWPGQQRRLQAGLVGTEHRVG